MNAELYISLSTLICSIAALLVAYVSLRISKQISELNSNNFMPRFIVNFQPNGIEVHHPDNNLYDIRKITVIVIRHIGFYELNNYEEVDIPVILHSRCFGHLLKQGVILDKDPELSKKRFKLYYSDGCFECPLKETTTKLINELEQVIETGYGQNLDRKFYAAPALRYDKCYVSIEYQTKIGTIKTFNQFYSAVGHGVDEIRQEITIDDFNSIIDDYKKMPIFESVFEMINHYSISK